MNQSISVPVAYEATLFVFDFRRELERAEMFRDSTRSSLRSVVQLLSRVINETSVENVKKVLQEAGVAEANNDDWVLQLVDRMQTGIYRSVTQGSLTPLMLKDVLQRADFTSLLETFNQNMGYAEIEQILHQSSNSMVCSSSRILLNLWLLIFMGNWPRIRAIILRTVCIPLWTRYPERPLKLSWTMS